MRQKRIVFLLLLLFLSFASCSPGHLGENEIAFVRDGHLWTIDPSGANVFEVVTDSAPVIGYAWSPDHHIFVFRLLDSTSAGKHFATNPITGLPGDLPSSLNTVGIDGGFPIPIVASSTDIQHSNAWWNTSGNRLLYREESTHAQDQSPIDVSWWVSQNDQPDGIARKSLPASYSIPSFTSSSSIAIGSSLQGIFTTTLAGTNLQWLTHGMLPGHPLPATLERVLWQPAHQQPALLYAVTATSLPSSSPQSFNGTAPAVQLVMRDYNGQTNAITTCYCTQFAWSPDGNSILYSTGTTDTIYTLKQHTAFSFTVEDGSVPYWSPDSQFLLLDGLHTLSLVQTANQRQQQLLADTSTGTATSTLPGAHALLQPVPNSLWASDSRHFLVLTRGRLLWQGQGLNSGNGLFSVTVDDQGHIQGTPAVVDTGNDSQAGWSYEDPNTSFLL